jgi:hypothetical protein
MAIFEIFYQPGKVFASLPERRRAWIAPLILGVLLSLCSTGAVVRLIGMETIMRQQLENTRLNITPEQKQAALNTANSPARVYGTYGVVLIAGIVVPLAVAGLLSVFAMMGSRQPRFGTMFSMVTLSLLPYTLIVAVMTILVLFSSPDRTTLDYQNLLATNVGAFMNKETTSRGLYTLLTSVDILTFLEIGLMSYGFSKVTRSSVFFGVVAVGGSWLLYVLAKVGLSLIF